MRFHLPTGTWSREDRYILSQTDQGGSAYFLHKSGYVAKEVLTTFGDDLIASEAAVRTITSNSATTTAIFAGGSFTTDRNIGQRVLLVKADGTRGEGTVKSNTATTLTLDAAWTNGLTPAEDDVVYFGVSDLGVELDTGVIPALPTAGVRSSLYSGSGTWLAEFREHDFPGDVTDVSSMDSATMSGDAQAGFPGRGPFQRVRLRYHYPDAGKTSLLQLLWNQPNA